MRISPTIPRRVGFVPLGDPATEPIGFAPNSHWRRRKGGAGVGRAQRPSGVAMRVGVIDERGCCRGRASGVESAAARATGLSRVAGGEFCTAHMQVALPATC
jgi:hypothetical protein